MTDPSPLDAPPSDRFERAFRLPEFVQTDPELVELYNEMVQSLRMEAKGLPMNTLQELLIERLASFYVQIKYKENTSTFTANQQREFNNYWLSLTQEFNRLLQASDEKLRDALLTEVQTIVLEAISLITDDEERRTVRRTLASSFATINL